MEQTINNSKSAPERHIPFLGSGGGGVGILSDSLHLLFLWICGERHLVGLYEDLAQVKDVILTTG